MANCRRASVTRMATYHIFNMIVFVRVFSVQIHIQSAKHEIAVVLVFHQLLHATDLQPADTQAVEHIVDNLFEELLIFTVSVRFQLDTLLPNEISLSVGDDGVAVRSAMSDQVRSVHPSVRSRKWKGLRASRANGW